MASNKAAWLTSNKAFPLEVKPSAYTKPRQGEVVVRSRAVAINPVDATLQKVGTRLMFNWLKYPFILGHDVAGEVVEVGEDVTRFKVGDRVTGNGIASDKKRGNPAEGTFQDYVVLMADMVSSIPDHISFEDACVIPLGLSTAAAGLFEESQLNLQLPSLSSKPTGETLLIWGGSTSVGCNAIQLALAAGYEVFATCSPKNFNLARRLGASKVFDYKSPGVAQEIVEAFKTKTAAGALWIGVGPGTVCMDILEKCKGRKFVSLAAYPVPPTPPKRFEMLTMMYYFLSGNASLWINSKLKGVGYSFIFASSVAFNGVGRAIYQDFLPVALASGKYIAAPAPIVAGKGLEQIQTAIDLLQNGISAGKVVVSM